MGDRSDGPAEAGVGAAFEVIGQRFDDIAAALWMFEGPQHRLVAVNRAARLSIGDRPIILGRLAREAVPELAEQRLLSRMDEVYRSGSPVFDQERVLIDLDGAGQFRELFVNAAIVPSRGPDGAVRGLVMQWADITQAALTRRDVAEELTELGQAAESAHAVVSVLQRVLLPAVLPVLPGVLLAARYLVTGREQASGGDWFDAVPLGGGRVGLVVGDVVGHGAQASAVMGSCGRC